MHEGYPRDRVLVGDVQQPANRRQITPRQHLPSSRLILAFFPADDAAASRAARRAAKAGIDSTLSCDRGKRNPRACRYSDLRFKDEQLLMAEASAATVQAA